MFSNRIRSNMGMDAELKDAEYERLQLIEKRYLLLKSMAYKVTEIGNSMDYGT